MDIDNAEKTDTTSAPAAATTDAPSSTDAAAPATTAASAVAEEEEQPVTDKMDESRSDASDATAASDNTATPAATDSLPDNVIVSTTDAASSMDEEPISLSDADAASGSSDATAPSTSSNTLDNEEADDGEVIVKEESDFDEDLFQERNEKLLGILETKKKEEKADPEVKMWKYREYGAPYFPSNYEIERMDFLIAKDATTIPKEGTDEGRKFFVIEQHLGDYFGKQCFRLFTHSGSATTASMVQEDEKWCLYFDNRNAAETKYKQIVEEKLASKYVEYELCFVPPASLLVGSDVAQDQIETGRYIIERLERYASSPSEEEAYDLVEKLFNALNTYRPSSPLCQLLQSFSVVRHVLENSFFLVEPTPVPAAKSEDASSAKAEAEAAATASTAVEATTTSTESADNPSGEQEKASTAEEGKPAEQPAKEDKMEKDDTTEVKQMDITTDEQPEKGKDIAVDSTNQQSGEEEEVSAEVHAERELQRLKVDVMHEWREVLFRLIECGTEFRGYYRQHKTVPIFEELSAKADFYLSVLLQPFASFHAPPGSVGTVNMTVGTIVPFGKDRLQTVKFVSVLTRAKNEVGVEDLLIREDPASGRRSLLFYCVESLFLFPWNNILHSYIVDIVKNILCDSNPLDAAEVEGEDDSPFFTVQPTNNKRLEHYLLSQCALIQRILALFSDEAKLAKSGHLGHLTIISNCIEERGDELFTGVDFAATPSTTTKTATPSTTTSTTAPTPTTSDKEAGGSDNPTPTPTTTDNNSNTTDNSNTTTTTPTPTSGTSEEKGTSEKTPEGAPEKSSSEKEGGSDEDDEESSSSSSTSEQQQLLLNDWHVFVSNRLKDINDVEQTIVYKPKTYPRFSFLNF